MISNSESRADDLIKIGILNIEDLEINRSGHLSDKQKRMLYLNLAFWLGVAAVEVSLLIAFIYPKILHQENFIVAALGIILLISLTYMCFKEAKPFWEDIKNDAPRSVAGKLYKKFHLTGNGKSGPVVFCSIRVGDEVLSVPAAIYDRAIHEDFYRIYFLTHTRRVINIEPL